MPAASVYGSLPLIAAECVPLTSGTAPMRMTWAPPAAPDPVGASVVSASAVALGRLVAPDRSRGAWIGGAMSTDAASAACQSAVGASATADGWVPGAADGNTATATPAASATGSAPGTRVVFLVAMVGKPSFWAACGVVDDPPPVTLAVDVLLSKCGCLGPPPPHAVTTRARSPAIAGIAPLRAPRDTRACMRARRYRRLAHCAWPGTGARGRCTARFLSPGKCVYCRSPNPRPQSIRGAGDP